MADLGPILSGDLNSSIGRSGIDNDEFVGDILHRGEALTQEALLVLDDHADAQPGLPVGVRQRRPGNWVGRLALFTVGVERACQRRFENQRNLPVCKPRFSEICWPIHPARSW